MTPRQAAILAAYKEHGNLRLAGRAVGVTGERVRQCLRVYEAETGVRFEDEHRLKPIGLIDWRCPDCGRATKRAPSYRATRCRSCASSKPGVAAAVVAARVFGKTWYAICTDHGRRPDRFAGMYQQIAWTFVTKLPPDRRDALIKACWPDGVPAWLLRKCKVPTARYLA